MGTADLRTRLVGSLAAWYGIEDRLRRSTAAARIVRQERSAFYRAVWQAAAESLGCTIVDLGGSLLEIRCGEVRLRVRDNVTSLDDPVTLNIAGDKALVYRLLEHERIPVPRHRVCGRGDVTSARRALSELGGPCVVKPAVSGAAGAGITTGVMPGDSIIVPLARAGARSAQVIVEEQVPGGNYRLLYLDGELVDAVLRRPPLVVGDGRSSMRQLIARENLRRARAGIDAAQSLIQVDAEVRSTLRVQGRTLSSIPARGAAVRIKTVVNDNRREENQDASGVVCASLIECGARSARALGVRLAGVDVITTDASVPFSESGGVVLEVNTTPGFYYHYARSGAGTPVATAILRKLAASGSCQDPFSAASGRQA
jgi:cyanophycin synthetase